MEGDAFGRPSGPLPEYVYWRRRAIAAVALLLAIGLIAWSCGGDDDRRNAGANQPGVGGPSAPLPSVPMSAPRVGATVTVTAAPKPPASRPPSSPTRPSADSADTRRACRSGDLRLALSADDDAYGPGERPKLAVRLTSARKCTVKALAKRLAVTITSGTDRIWSSADCAGAGRGGTRTMSPHRPYEKVITWRRIRSDPDDCDDGGTSVKARPGWYVAVADLGDVRSAKAVFQLHS